MRRRGAAVAPVAVAAVAVCMSKAIGNAAYNTVFHKIAHPAGIAECAVFVCYSTAYFALQGIASIGIETIV